MAESRIVFSDSREAEKDCELVLSCEAMERREAVRDSCSVRLCVRRASEVWDMEEPVVVERSSARSDRGARERRAGCDSSDVCEGGKSGVGGISGWRSEGSVGAKAGDVACSGEGVLDWGSICEACEWESVSSEGVSSPRRSSPSEESSSWSSFAPSYPSSVYVFLFLSGMRPTSWSSSNRSLNLWIISRFLESSICVSCFRVWTLMFWASCSNFKRSDRACSRFYTLIMRRITERQRPD